MPGTEWVVATIVALALAYLGGRRGRGREADLELAVVQDELGDTRAELEEWKRRYRPRGRRQIEQACSSAFA